MSILGSEFAEDTLGLWRGGHTDPQGKSKDKMTGKVGQNKPPTLCYSLTSNGFGLGFLWLVGCLFLVSSHKHQGYAFYALATS